MPTRYDPMSGLDSAPDPFEDPELSDVKSGRIAPFQVADPAARSAAYGWWSENRGNRASPPSVEAAAQAQIDATKGTGVPHISERSRQAGFRDVGDFVASGQSEYGTGEEAMRVAEAIRMRDAAKAAERQRMAGEFAKRRLTDTAARISRKPPERWGDEIEKANARFRRTGIVEQGAFITPDDVARAGGRRYRPTGIEGSAPLVVGQQPKRSAGGATAGNLIQTPMGDYRPEMIQGRMVGVPVVKVPGGAIPNPLGDNVTRESWSGMYTEQDAALTRRMLMSQGMTDWAMQQRAIDSARASLSDGTYSPEEIAAARTSLKDRENALHYEYLVSDAGSMSLGISDGQPQLDMTDPRETERKAKADRDAQDAAKKDDEAKRKAIADENEYAQKVMNEYGVDEQQARVAAKNRFSPDAPLLKKREKAAETKDEKPAFDYEDFSRGFDAELARATKAASSSGGRDYMSESFGDEAQDTPEIRNSAFRKVMLSKYGSVDPLRIEKSFQAARNKILEEYASMSSARGDKFVRKQVRAAVMAHLPMFEDEINDPYDVEGINKIVDRYMPNAK